MATGIESISRRALSNPNEKFNALMHHFSEENLRDCFLSLDGNKALGTDGISKADYGQNLEENLRNLVYSLKRMSYKPKQVRIVEIEKDDGSKRPLGISCFEDKIIQEMTRRILEAIYEPTFIETSYGFRPGRSCHDALKRLDNEIISKPANWLLDMDISRFFDTMPHENILKILAERISDRKFLRLISRQLKSGINNPIDEMGTVQGSVVSPIIANVYLDVVLDKWFAEELKEYFTGYCELIRYADDAVAVFENEDEAAKFVKVLPLRLAKYGLELNINKTRIIRFNRKDKDNSFDFLGFTHYWGKGRNGKVSLKRKTSKKRLRKAILKMSHWIKHNRNKLPLHELWDKARSKIQGHINYYGISDNFRSLQKYDNAVKEQLFIWLNRRSQRKSFSWESFRKYMSLHPLPRPKIIVKLY